MKKMMAFLVMAVFVAMTAVSMAADAPAAAPAAPAATAAAPATAPAAAPAAPAKPVPPPIANQVGMPVPAWEVKAADSDVMLTSEKLKGQPYGIVFVNSSCASCRSEMGSLVKMKFDKFTLIVAAVDAKLERVLAVYRDQAKITFPIVDDSKFALAKKFGVSFTPASVIVGEDGKLAAWNAGFTEENAEKVMEDFAKFAIKKK